VGIVYWIMFFVGILYTFISFAISGISGALHLGSHISHMHTHASNGNAAGHMGNIHSHNANIGHDFGITHTFLLWLTVLINPLVAVSFLTVFGGLGILGTDYFKWMAVVVFFVSLLAGVFVSFILYKFIVIPLYKSENSTEVSREDLIYTTADVISPIMKNGFGEIKYTVNSIRCTAPAKHFKGNAVKQGEKVIIYNIENNIFYVIEYGDLNNLEIE
jgi:hypothetical protein